MNNYSPTKAMQATGVLLKRAHYREMSRVRLLKLLYIADREMLSGAGHLISGDRVVAMDHGPVLSQTYSLIKGEALRAQKDWDRHFERVSYCVRLIEDPGNSELSVEEIEKLEEVFFRYEGKDEWDIVRETHEFPEWIKNHPSPGSSVPIPIEDILASLGMADWTEDLIAASEAADELERLLAAAAN